MATANLGFYIDKNEITDEEKILVYITEGTGAGTVVQSTVVQSRVRMVYQILSYEKAKRL